MIFSCGKATYLVNDIKGNNIKITDSLITDNELESVIVPYRNEIKQLEEVIGYSNESLSVREGELESTLGNLIADILIEVCNPVFNNLTKQNIDFSLFNYGGIRGTMNKGNITQHNMFTIMPFKNLATVVKLDGNKVLELLNYLNKENIAHPISGIKIEFNLEKVKAIIDDKKFDTNKSYYVLTSNFLQEGGDKMIFFKDPQELHPLNLNIRDVLISSIKNKETISSKLDNRIIRIR
jgi:5'-nucleotidase